MYVISAISPDNRGRQQIESPFDEKTSITYNNDGDLVGNIWPKTGLPQSYPVASIPSQSPLIALPSKYFYFLLFT